MGDIFGNVAQRLRIIFRVDKVHHDNLLFKLHHQVNFGVLLLGVLFIFGENYLYGNAIVCHGEKVDKYAESFCWLHGADYVADHLGLCAAEKKSDRHTSYYLWLPILLGVCMGLVKLPRVIWKNLCERGLMENLVGVEEENAEKIANNFMKLKRKKKNRSAQYLVLFAFCEFLNVVMLLICFLMVNSLLHKNFWTYGALVSQHYIVNGEDRPHANPMCKLFPTVVACNVKTGGIGSGYDKSNFICMLSNNLFNQYFFLILWFWWIILLIISVIGLVYRLGQMFLNSFSKMILQNVYLAHFNLEDEVNELNLTSPEYFLLGRLAVNVKGSTLEKVIKELKSRQMLAAAPPQEQKQMLGERLFPLIQRMFPDLAGKITGMLLEIDNAELVHMLEDQNSLKGKVEEAVAVLQAHQGKTGDKK